MVQASKLIDDRFRIYITGTGELTEKLHEEARGDNKITFTGRIDDTELKALILASDMFCFPSISKNEAFGLALAEGMYYEKPAVTFTIPGSGVNYVSLNRVTGIEVENRNVEKYADAMQTLAQNKLNITGLEDRIWQNTTNVSYIENDTWKTGDEKMRTERETSTLWLKNALEDK